MSKVRTRIAPSPSSAEKTLHFGNVRSCLYSYLVAKQAGGDFILRVENTDIARNVEGCAEGMYDDLVWLGLTPTEGFGTNNQPLAPYTQLERLKQYGNMCQYLIDKGMAYKCICTEESLNAAREAAIAANPKAPFKYPGTCRDANHKTNENYVVRFKAPTDGEYIHNDLVYGKIVFTFKENYDWVIMRANGVPLYNFSCFSDDYDHKTTHIVRGRDHLSNIISQVLFYKAFDAPIPQMAHLPMVLNQKGEKLSKRDGAASVKEFKELGYSPSALLNYIFRLGFGSGNKEIFSMQEMIETFDITKCGRNDGKFDPKKLLAIQFEHLKSTILTSNEEYADRTIPFLHKLGLNNLSPKDIIHAIPVIRNRAKTFVEAANELAPIFQTNIALDKEASVKFLTDENKLKLKDFSTFLEGIDDYDWSNSKTIRSETNNWLTQHNSSMKEFGQPLRVSVFGKTQSPELFEVMSLLGKVATIKRIKNCYE